MTLTPNDLPAEERGNILSWVSAENRARTSDQFATASRLWYRLCRREQKAHAAAYESIVHELLDMAVDVGLEPTESMLRECEFVEYITYADRVSVLVEATQLYKHKDCSG